MILGSPDGKTRLDVQPVVGTPGEAESSDFEEFENYQRECFAPYVLFALRQCAENCFRMMSLKPGDCLEISEFEFSDLPENLDFLSFGTGHLEYHFHVPDHSCEASIYPLKCGNLAGKTSIVDLTFDY